MKGAPRGAPELAGYIPALSRETGEIVHTRSITMAMPWPTPMHMVHSA